MATSTRGRDREQYRLSNELLERLSNAARLYRLASIQTVSGVNPMRQEAHEILQGIRAEVLSMDGEARSDFFEGIRERLFLFPREIVEWFFDTLIMLLERKTKRLSWRLHEVREQTCAVLDMVPSIHEWQKCQNIWAE